VSQPRLFELYCKQLWGYRLLIIDVYFCRAVHDGVRGEILPSKVVEFGHKFLSNRFCYDGFQSAVGSYKFKNGFLEESFSDFQGSRVLDLGCGTGVAAKFTGKEVKYFGIDVSSQYIDSVLAKKSDATVHVGSVSESEPYNSISLENLDLTLALGLFHHITDHEMMLCLENLREVMSEGSVLKSFDPVIDESTTKLAAWVAKNDRGQNLRTPEEFHKIFEKFSFKVEYRIVRNVIRIPVDLIICEVSAI
jgi:SAM-dependent methyltransferase